MAENLRGRSGQRSDRVKLSESRAIALEIGRIVRERNAYTQEIAHTVLRGHAQAKGADRAFATKLALGVTSSLGTLDEVIDSCLRSPQDVQPDVRDALRISTYEMVFLRKESHIAVSQGVELVRSVQPKAAGLANAVLRKVAKTASSFPFGDPSVNDAAFSRAQAFPYWLSSLLIEQLGSEKARSFIERSNEDAPVFLFCNTLSGTDASSEEGFRDLVETVGEEGEGFLLLSKDSVAREPIAGLLGKGALIVSDYSAQRIASFALPSRKPESVLEIGAGRGTKTVMLQNLASRRYGQQLSICSVDDHEFKMDLLKKRCAALGVNVSEAIAADATDLSDALPGRTFDCVFIDAPCSGLGTLRRHPEIRWRISKRDLDGLANLGFRLLHEASKHVADDGVLTYATCTVLPQENEMVVKRFLRSSIGQSFRVEDTLVTELASGGCDAHYAVRLRKLR